MILVTVGSQKFEFNRLLRKIDELIEKGVITDKVYCQTGCSSYIPRHCDHMTFLPKYRMDEEIGRADLIITHAGTGSIMEALEYGKKVIAVPRLAAYNEHVDDHQKEVVAALMQMGVIEGVLSLDDLEDALKVVMTKTYKPYVSTRDGVISQLEEWIESY